MKENICGDRNEVGSLSSTRYEHWSTIDSVANHKLSHGVAELEDSKGSSARGVR